MLFAELGIGGLAFAIAAHDTIANFFGSALLLADRPFRRGDHIIAGDLEGFVEQLGLRSTRLRTFDDSIVFHLVTRNRFRRFPGRSLALLIEHYDR